jgi:hypothetical protein
MWIYIVGLGILEIFGDGYARGKYFLSKFLFVVEGNFALQLKALQPLLNTVAFLK